MCSSDATAYVNNVRVFLHDACAQEKFIAFVDEQSSKDDIWKYWSKFVLSDCFCYIQLYLAIRDGNWSLRLSAIKAMAPLFAAFDQSIYMQIIPHHLNEICNYPKPILQCLQMGGFTVSLTGQNWNRIGFDEAHEIKINKDLKSAIVRPSPGYLEKMSIFFNYRIRAYDNFTNQIMPIKQKNPLISSKDQINNENIDAIIRHVSEHGMFSCAIDRSLGNIFTNQIATPQQAHDMLNFTAIGKKVYAAYVTHRILQVPSTASAPLRKSKLLTMAPTKKVTKKKMNDIENERH